MPFLLRLAAARHLVYLHALIHPAAYLDVRPRCGVGAQAAHEVNDARSFLVEPDLACLLEQFGCRAQVGRLGLRARRQRLPGGVALRNQVHGLHHQTRAQLHEPVVYAAHILVLADGDALL